MRSTITLIFLASLSTFLLACQPAGDQIKLPTAPEVSVEGFDEAVAQQVQAAYAKYRSAPESIEHNGQMAMLLHSYRQPELATVFYQRARQLDKSNYQWPYLHALILDQLGEPKQTDEALRDTLTLNVGYLPAQLKYAEHLAKNGKLEQSATLFTRIVEKFPDLPQALYGLGQIRLEQEDESAVELLERAAKGKFPFGAVNYALAQAYQKRGDDAKAARQLALFEKSRDFVPPLDDPLMSTVRDLNQSKRGHMQRARELLANRKLPAAASAFEAAIAADPTDVGARVFLIVVYGQLGQLEEAEKNYEEAIALDPEHVQARVNLGVLRVKQRRLDDAVEAFESALTIDPDYVAAHLKLGAILGAMNEPDEATEHFRAVQALEPLNREASYQLGLLLFKQAKYQESIDEISAIIEPADRQTPQHLNVLANAYLALKDYPQAQATLERAIAVATSTGQVSLIDNLRENLRRLSVVQEQAGETGG